ncbi:MAG TPA: protein kinase [Rubrobacter sp.]|nr:protein kinase [Rubrobacter sp.]
MQHTRLGNRYELQDLVGGGGMAEVYLAHDAILDRDVALKILRGQFAGDEEFVERFKREALSAAGLSHPNIVSVYDRGTEVGTSYIAMEYVPGGTLKERLSSDGPLDPTVVASLGLQISEALQAAHERGVIHRDIKPQNVLLTEGGEVKVADFGIARAASAATISQTGLILGTAGYMSPEQALGKAASPRSDLYCLGVLLYEMLTGEQPYTADNPIAVSMKHVTEAPRAPREVNPEVPEGMNALVLKLLAKDPQDRYANAAELSGDLRRLRDGLPPIAADPAEDVTEATRVEAQGQKRMPWILTVALGLFVVLGAAGWGMYQGLWAPDSTPGAIGRVAEVEVPAGVEVPDVEGLGEDQARRELAASGLEAAVKHSESTAASEGEVLDQSPAAGERIERGSRVTIRVGDGSAPLEVPNVVGLSPRDAEAQLDEAGLSVGQKTEVASDTAEVGTVVEQEYPPGSEVEPDTAVDLAISSGPQQIVPGAASQGASASAPTSTPASAPASFAEPATASNAPSVPASTPATTPATVPALGEDVQGIVDEDNSGPGHGGGGNGGGGNGGGGNGGGGNRGPGGGGGG